MSEKEVLEMINYINSMNNDDFCDLLKETEKEIFTKEFCEELNKGSEE